LFILFTWYSAKQKEEHPDHKYRYRSKPSESQKSPRARTKEKSNLASLDLPYKCIPTSVIRTAGSAPLLHSIHNLPQHVDAKSSYPYLTSLLSQPFASSSGVSKKADLAFGEVESNFGDDHHLKSFISPSLPEIVITRSTTNSSATAQLRFSLFEEGHVLASKVAVNDANKQGTSNRFTVASENIQPMQNPSVSSSTTHDDDIHFPN